MGRIPMALLVWLLCVAAAPEEPGRKLLDEGLTHYMYGRYDRSVEVLQRARRVAQDPEVRARIHLYLGVNHIVREDADRAREAFVEALNHDSGVRLDPHRFKPSIVNEFERVREQVRGTREPPEGEAESTEGEAESTGGEEGSTDGRSSETWWHRDRVWTWIAAGTMAASFVAAGGLWAAVQSDHETYLDPETPDATARALEEPIRRKVRATNGAIGVGAGLAATALLLFFVEDGGGEADTAQKQDRAVDLSIGIGSGTAMIRGTF